MEEGNAELYAKLFPYILRDFVFKDDLKTSLITCFPIADLSALLNIDASPEGIKKALMYKALLDSGEDNLENLIKPVIKI